MSVVIDPATDAFLAQVRDSGGKPLYELPVEEVRAMIGANSEMLAGTPLEVGSVLDRTIDAGGLSIPVRIYTPSGEHRGALPVVLYFHGGGFVAGSLDTHSPTARYLCQNADAIVVAVGYRKSPEHKFPAAVEDAVTATTWVAEHAKEIGGDGARLAVAGDSAGGNLATVVCQLARQRGGPRIAFQALFYPLVDFTLTNSPSRSQFGGGDFFLSNREMEWFRDLYLTSSSEASDPQSVAAAGVGYEGPATRADHRGRLRPAARRRPGLRRPFAAGRRGGGYRCFEGTIHAFMSFCGAIPMGREALALAASRLRAALQ